MKNNGEWDDGPKLAPVRTISDTPDVSNVSSEATANDTALSTGGAYDTRTLDDALR